MVLAAEEEMEEVASLRKELAELKEELAAVRSPGSILL